MKKLFLHELNLGIVPCKTDWYKEWMDVHKQIDELEKVSGCTINTLIAAFARGCTLKEPEYISMSELAKYAED